jgi:hypothetical protein
MTKKRKRPRRSSALEGDEAEPLSPPLVDPTKPFKERKQRKPKWQIEVDRKYPAMSEEQFLRCIGEGPVAFTRPGGSSATAAQPAEQTPPPAGPHPVSKRRTGRQSRSRR